MKKLVTTSVIIGSMFWLNMHAADVSPAILGDIEGVIKILNQGQDVNDQLNGGTMLWHAASWNHSDIVELLIMRGADVDTPDCGNVFGSPGSGMTPLIAAANFNNHLSSFKRAESPFKTIKLLLDNKAQMHIADVINEWTALHYAHARGHNDVVKLLLEHKAQV